MGFDSPQTLTASTTGATIIVLGTWDGSTQLNILNNSAGDAALYVDAGGGVNLKDDGATNVGSAHPISSGLFLAILTVDTNGTLTFYYTGRSAGEIGSGSLGDITFDTIGSADNGATNRLALPGAGYNSAFTANQVAGVSAYYAAQTWGVGL